MSNLNFDKYQYDSLTNHLSRVVDIIDELIKSHKDLKWQVDTLAARVKELEYEKEQMKKLKL